MNKLIIFRMYDKIQVEINRGIQREAVIYMHS